MDPVTMAIIEAIRAGAAAGAATVATKAVVESYEALKKKLAARFGRDSRLLNKVEQLEEEPDSQGAALMVQEQVAKTGAVEDKEIEQLAQRLIELLKPEPAQITHLTVSSGERGIAAGGDISQSSLNTGTVLGGWPPQDTPPKR